MDPGLPSQKLIREGLKDIEVKEALFLASHVHTDHLSYSAMRVLEEMNKKVLVPKGLKTSAISTYFTKRKREPTNCIIGEFPLRPFRFKDIFITPFVVPHDMRPTVGFRIGLEKYGEDGPIIAIGTDFGHITEPVINGFAGADLMVVEANYDPDLLNVSKRPFSQKMRISGPYGHLSNEAAARLVIEASRSGRLPQFVVLAHLSGDHNEPGRALNTVKNRLNMAFREPPMVLVASREAETDWIQIF